MSMAYDRTRTLVQTEQLVPYHGNVGSPVGLLTDVKHPLRPVLLRQSKQCTWAQYDWSLY